jgi:hypothetical protein
VDISGSLSVNNTPTILGTGTAGQVAFWNGTNSQTGSNNLFWNNTNGRLGVGTNAPNHNLDVLGSIRIQNTGSLFFGSSGTSTPISSIFYDGTDHLKINHTVTNKNIDFSISYGGTLIQPVSIQSFDTPGIILKNLSALGGNSAVLQIGGSSNRIQNVGHPNLINLQDIQVGIILI